MLNTNKVGFVKTSVDIVLKFFDNNENTPIISRKNRGACGHFEVKGHVLLIR